MKPSILRNLLLISIVFWLVLGLLLPLVAHVVVAWDPGLLVWIPLVVLAAPVLGFSNYQLVNIVLLRKLKQISAAANAISENDLTVRCELESHDLIGDIVNSFNEMRDKLRAMLNDIASVTSQLASAAEQLSATAEQTRRGLDEQREGIEQVATAMNQMTASVQEIAHSAASAAEQSGIADGEAKGGALVATDAIGGIESLKNQVESGAGVIRKLEEEVEGIGVVLDVIREIAEQTNMLALNAAIEAARAGEQGRGFAVVAEEVHTLASRTQHSTQEIQSMIERLQAGSGEAVSAMDQAREGAESCTGQVEEAAENLATIAGSVSQINDMNAQIASAAEEQSQVAEEINRNITSSNQAAEDTAAGSRQIAVAAEELARLSSRLQTLMERFNV